MIPAGLAAALRGPQSAIVEIDGVRQCGYAHLDFSDAPRWVSLTTSDIDSLLELDEAIIESFVVDGGELVALSDSPWLERWRPRAAAFAAEVKRAASEAQVALAWPGHLTCSITPTHLLEGQRHFDDDQYRPDDGLGIVAVTGQHRAPGLATGLVRCTGTPRPGPLPIGDEQKRDATWNDAAPTRPDDIVLLGAFGQLHAGPSHASFGDQPPRFRQLMVLRVPTVPRR